jgi:hypothetical protein
MRTFTNTFVNKLLGVVLTLFFSSSFATYSHAGMCTPDLAINQLKLDEISSNGEEAKNRNKYLEAMSFITSKAPKDDIPLNQQLSIEDQAKFQHLRDELLQSKMRSLYYSWFVRDVTAISDASKIVEILANGGEIEEGDPRYTYQEIVMLLRFQLDKYEFDMPDVEANKDCNMDVALGMLQRFETTQLDRDSLLNASKRLSQLAEKYNFDATKSHWWNDIPVQGDKDIALNSVEMLTRAQNSIKHLKDLENLRRLYALSRKKLSTYVEEISNLKTEQQMKNVGSAWKKRVLSMSEKEKGTNLVLLFIEQKIKSDVDIELNGNKKQR